MGQGYLLCASAEVYPSVKGMFSHANIEKEDDEINNFRDTGRNMSFFFRSLFFFFFTHTLYFIFTRDKLTQSIVNG